MALKLIRKAGGVISAYDDSILFHNALISQSGILEGVGNEMDAYTESDNLVIKDGYCVLQGRQFVIEATESITMQKPTSGTFYYIVYAIINTEGSEETVTLTATYASADYPALPESNDIVKSRGGKAYITLYKATTTVNGIESFEKVAPLISSSSLLNTSLENLSTTLTTYIDTKVSQHINAVNPYLSLRKYYTSSDINTAFNLNTLFQSGEEKYLILIRKDSSLSSSNLTSLKIEGAVANSISAYLTGYSETDLNNGNYIHRTISQTGRIFYIDGEYGSGNLSTCNMLLISKLTYPYGQGQDVIKISTLDCFMPQLYYCENADNNQFNLFGKFQVYKFN